MPSRILQERSHCEREGVSHFSNRSFFITCIPSFLTADTLREAELLPSPVLQCSHFATSFVRRQRQTSLNALDMASSLNDKYVAQKDNVIHELAANTVGLVHYEDFKRLKGELEDRKHRDAFEGGAITP